MWVGLRPSSAQFADLACSSNSSDNQLLSNILRAGEEGRSQRRLLSHSAFLQFSCRVSATVVQNTEFHKRLVVMLQKVNVDTTINGLGALPDLCPTKWTTAALGKRTIDNLDEFNGREPTAITGAEVTTVSNSHQCRSG